MAAGRRRRQRVSSGQPGAQVISAGLLQRAVRALAVLGLGVSAYLTYLHYSEASAALCPAGSGCDIVRSSDYSAIVGIPVAILGTAGFALILAVSLSRLTPSTKGALLYISALAGVTFSAYLTYLEVAVIEAICPYCVVSALLMTGILVLLLLQRPVVPGLSANSLRLYSGLVVVLVVVASMVAWRGADGVGGDDTGDATAFQVALAQHLTEKGAVMYGAYWCPHCKDQKEWFGSAFKYVNYVECDPRGEHANPALCDLKGIRGYPTWEIDGRFYEGARSLEALARLSGYSQ